MFALWVALGRPLGGPLGAFCMPLEPYWGHLGHLGAILRRFGAFLDHLEVLFGALLVRFGAFVARLGPSWGHLGSS